MMRFCRSFAVAVVPLVLAACQQQPAPQGGGKAAGGEVLPGSVSDAMIDLDGATGTPPLQPAPKARASDKAPASEAPAAAPEPAPAEPAAPAQ